MNLDLFFDQMLFNAVNSGLRVEKLSIEWQSIKKGLQRVTGGGDS